MKTSRSISLPIEVWSRVEKVAKEEAKTFNETVELLINQGYIRHTRLVAESGKLYPSAEEMR